jgi:hypothetical protein
LKKTAIKFRKKCETAHLNMCFVANQAIFRVNQELMTLIAANRSVHAKVDCFNVSKRSELPIQRTPTPEGFYASSPLVASPLGYAIEEAAPMPTDQHLTALMAALSGAFPDFDFSTVCPWNFKLIREPERAQSVLNWAFQSELHDCEHMLGLLWSTLEKEISPAMCSIYSYESDQPDAFSESGAVVNLCYFFLNEKLGRVVLVHLREGGNDFDSGSDNDDLEDLYGFSVF